MRLDEYMRAQRIGVREFARRSGVSASMVSRLRAGKRRGWAMRTLTASRIWRATQGRVSPADYRDDWDVSDGTEAGAAGDGD